MADSYLQAHFFSQTHLTPDDFLTPLDYCKPAISYSLATHWSSFHIRLSPVYSAIYV